MKRIAVLSLLVASVAFAAPKESKFVVPHETDPNSPRHTLLKSKTPDPNEIVRVDVTNCGHPQIIETWWNGFRVRWIGEGGTMKWTDTRGSMVDDVLQVDRDGDGYYDGPGDLNVKWVDDDGDGRPDLQIFAANPAGDARTPHAGLSHFMIFVDDGKADVLGYLNFHTFEFHMDNWHTPATRPYQHNPDPDFRPHYEGNSSFLKQHFPAWLVTDPRYNWENPFLFYDFTGSGCTNMSIRILDTTVKGEGATAQKPMETYRTKANEAFVSYDLDASATVHNEFSYDMTLKFTSEADGSKGDRLDYTKFHHPHPKLKAPDWALKYFRFDNWRKIDELIYTSHEGAYDEIFKPNWGQTWMTFDEDNDDHRWERVELGYPTDDPYSVERWKGSKHTGGGLGAHPQSDILGDRSEWDFSNKGHGKIYIGKWDHKIHLYGADKGAWAVDYGAKYWGSSPVVGDSSPDRPTKVGEVVQYFDTDGNGFIDKIVYDYDGDRKPDLVINLLDYKTADNPHPDECKTLDPAQLKWEGMHKTFQQIAYDSFQDAKRVYRAAFTKGLTTDEMDQDLSFAASTFEQYDHGYWLKEKLFRILDKKVKDPTELRKAYFTGDTDGVIKIIESLDPMPRAK